MLKIEEVDFPRVVEEIQKIDWPKNEHLLEQKVKEAVMDLNAHVGPLMEMVGIIVNSFIEDTLSVVHPKQKEDMDHERQWMLEQMVAQVIEDAHPEIMYGILAKIKTRLLKEFSEENWKKYGGW